MFNSLPDLESGFKRAILALIAFGMVLGGVICIPLYFLLRYLGSHLTILWA